MEMAQFNQQFGQGNQMVDHLNLSWLLDRYTSWSPLRRARADWRPSLVNRPWDQTTILLHPDYSLAKWANRFTSRFGRVGVSTAGGVDAIDNMLANKHWLATQSPYFNSSSYWPRLSFDWYSPDWQRQLRQLPPVSEFQDSWATETEDGAAETSLPRPSPVVVPATPDMPSIRDDGMAAALPEPAYRSLALLKPSTGILRPLVTSTLGSSNSSERRGTARGLSLPALVHPVGQMRLLTNPEDVTDPSSRPGNVTSPGVGLAYDGMDLPVLVPAERQRASIALSNQSGYTINDLETFLSSEPRLVPAAAEISTSVLPAVEILQNQFSGNQAFAPRLPLPVGPAARSDAPRAAVPWETQLSAGESAEKPVPSMGLIEQTWTNVGVQSASPDGPLTSGFSPVLGHGPGAAASRTGSLPEPLSMPIAPDSRQRGLPNLADDSAGLAGDSTVVTSPVRAVRSEEALQADAPAVPLVGGDFGTIGISRSGNMPVFSMGLPELSILRRGQLTTGLPLSQRMWLPLRQQILRQREQEEFEGGGWMGTPDEAESAPLDEGRGEGWSSPVPEASFLARHRFQSVARYLRDAGETGVPDEAEEYSGFGEEDNAPDSAFQARLGAPPERIPLPLATVFPRATMGGRADGYSETLPGVDSGSLFDGAGSPESGAGATSFSWSLPAMSFSHSEAAGSSPTLARAAIDRPSGEGAASGDSGASAGQAGGSGQGPDLDEITRQVYALLKQRLSLERERTWGRGS